jgi:hypothetical protein
LQRQTVMYTREHTLEKARAERQRDEVLAKLRMISDTLRGSQFGTRLWEVGLLKLVGRTCVGHTAYSLQW